MPSGFEVHAYLPDTFESVIESIITRSNSIFSPEIIRRKPHIEYLKEYLLELGTKTVVVESEYIDRDFLEDFAGYYVRCFQPYEKKCSRLHFFAVSISEEELRGLLRGAPSGISLRELNEHYLGFIVIKPLPQTITGRTCIRPYPKGGGRREYSTVRRYKANLFGMALDVESLAFQEQDSVTAACATSALWSVFHGTGELFHHFIPSPVEITKAATEHSPVLSRTLPNKDGLTGEQMAHAIRGVGLEPLHAGFNDAHVLKATLFAYLYAKVPAVLGFTLWDISNQAAAMIGRHAVAVAGYSLGLTAAKPYPPSDFLLKASRMDKIYVHDDQIGPFARMAFDTPPLQMRTLNPGLEYCLSTSWKGKDGKRGSIIAIPDLILIPLYHKIRIPFEVVHQTVIRFSLFLDLLRSRGVLPTSASPTIEWDIHLTTVNDLKSDLFQSKSFDGVHREKVLTENMPRFIWRATAYGIEGPILDLLFDATDIEQGCFFVGAVEYDAGFSHVLRTVSKLQSLIDQFNTSPEWRIIDWFRKMPVPDPTDSIPPPEST